MEKVGVRELKSALSRYLKRVRSGETIVVTDRGRPVARIIPVGIPEGIAKLMAEGRVTWSGKPFRPPKKLIHPRPGPPFSDYIAEDRR
jgi:prevent-host-death family protein